MFKKVVAHPDGRVIFYYPDKKITFNKNKIAEVSFSAKEVHDYKRGNSTISFSGDINKYH